MTINLMSKFLQIWKFSREFNYNENNLINCNELCTIFHNLEGEFGLYRIGKGQRNPLGLA